MRHQCHLRNTSASGPVHGPPLQVQTWTKSSCKTRGLPAPPPRLSADRLLVRHPPLHARGQHPKLLIRLPLRCSNKLCHHGRKRPKKWEKYTLHRHCRNSSSSGPPPPLQASTQINPSRIHQRPPPALPSRPSAGRFLNGYLPLHPRRNVRTLVGSLLMCLSALCSRRGEGSRAGEKCVRFQLQLRNQPTRNALPTSIHFPARIKLSRAQREAAFSLV